MEWISVNDRLPDKGEFVFAYSNRELNMKMQVVNLFHSWDNTYTGYQLNGNCMAGVTHWMPLPEPPKV